MVRSRKIKKDVLGFVKAGVVMGVGSQVLSGVGGSSAGYAASGIGNVAKFMPAMGTVVGGRMVLDAFGNLQPRKRRRRR